MTQTVISEVQDRGKFTKRILCGVHDGNTTVIVTCLMLRLIIDKVLSYSCYDILIVWK